MRKEKESIIVSIPLGGIGMKKKYNVQGMMCAACQANVDRAVKKIDGVKNCNVSLLASNMVVEFDENQVKEETIFQEVEKAGYHATPFVNESIQKIQEKRKQELKKQRNKLILTFVLLALLMVDSMVVMMLLSYPKMDQVGYGWITFVEVSLQILLLIPILILNFHYFPSGYKSLFKGHPNMNSLVALGCTISTLYGLFSYSMILYGCILGGDEGGAGHSIVMNYSMNLYFESAAMILAFVSIGKYFEKKATNKTTASIASLMALTPDTAYLVLKDEIKEVPTDTLQEDDIVLVREGESIPTDGLIIQGYGNMDESTLTGESLPVYKTVNDKVIGASINKSGSFKMRVTSVGKDTTIAKIISLVEQASESKAPIARLADKISLIFVPVVISLALLTFTLWMLLFHVGNVPLPQGYSSPFSASLNYAITVLVISCPCALGLATPVAIMVGTGKGAENGILIKSAQAFETMEKVDYILLDKTGTLTKGEMKVKKILSYENSEEENLTLGASLEQYSQHPLSLAITSLAKEKALSLTSFEDFLSIPGQGVKGSNLLLGNEKMMKENDIDIEGAREDYLSLSNQGNTVLFLAREKKLCALFAIGDSLKDHAKETIASLKKMGKKVAIVTGDQKNTADAIAKELEVDEVFSQVLPDEKEEIVASLQKRGNRVAFIGDGVNDAPALMRADVGIAIGAGSDIAMESGDIILVRSDMRDILSCIQLSHKVVNNIKENLLWAFLYNILLIPLAAGALSSIGVMMNPMYGSIAMSISSVTVVLNALRLRLFKREHSTE